MKKKFNDFSKSEWDMLVKEYNSIESEAEKNIKRYLKEDSEFRENYGKAMSEEMHKKYYGENNKKLEYLFSNLSNEVIQLLILHRNNPNSIKFLKRGYGEKVKKKRNIKTCFGLLVCSEGEKKIAEFLHASNIGFSYDELMSLYKPDKENETFSTHPYGKTQFKWVRPDFVLDEYFIVIEYFGLKGKKEYDKSIRDKKRLYGFNKYYLIPIFPEDLRNIEIKLRSKLMSIPYKEIENKSKLKKLLLSNQEKLKRRYN